VDVAVFVVDAILVLGLDARNAEAVDVVPGEAEQGR